jgi:hypothetical protein
MNPLTLTCPDCTAAVTVDIAGPGVTHVVMEHDDSCPRLNRAARRRAKRSH